MSITFQAQTANGATGTWVDNANYRSTFDVKASMSTRRENGKETDTLRIEARSLMRDVSQACENQCGLSRTDKVLFQMSLALGQPAEYYTRKEQQLRVVKNYIDRLLSEFTNVPVGVTPNLGANFTVATE